DDGNDGNDVVTAQFSQANGFLSYQANLGSGADTFTLDANWPNWVPPPGWVPPAVGFRIDGAAGDDVIRVNQVFPVGYGTGIYAPPPTNRVDIIDDQGSNDITVNYEIIAILQPSAAPPPVFNTALATSIRTGNGRDNISV